MSQQPTQPPETLLILRQEQQFTFVWQDKSNPSLPMLAHHQLEAGQLQELLKAMQQVAVDAAYLSQANRSAKNSDTLGNAEEDLRRLGRTLCHRLLPEALQEHLNALPPHSALCLMTNDEALPWELIILNNTPLALRHAISRQPLRMAKARSTHWNPQHRLNCLLIGNPTGDLAAADEEIEALIEVLDSAPQAVHTEWWGSRTTKARLLDALDSQKYDLIHFAGHARPGAIALADGWLETDEIQRAVNGSPFIFLNGCASAQANPTSGSAIDLASSLDEIATISPYASLGNSGLAQAFLLGGASAFIGTLWPVLDESAQQLAVNFYKLALQGYTTGEALRQARLRSQQYAPQQLVWAAVVLYGNPHQRLFSQAQQHHIGTVLVIEQRGKRDDRAKHIPADNQRMVEWRNLIRRYGGEVTTLTPAQAVALFGVTHAIEDDGERALRAAIALRRIALAQNEHSLGLGIASGMIESDDEQTTSGMVLYWGEAVTQALQLAQQAQAGDVLVNEYTRRLTEQIFTFESGSGEYPRPPEQTIFRLVSDAVAALPPLLVERTRELDNLHRHWQDAQQGQGNLVGVMGEAGIGKSALVDVFRAERRNQPMHYLSLTARKIDVETPLSFLATLLRTLLGIQAEASPETIREQVSQRIVRCPELIIEDQFAQFIDYLLELLEVANASLQLEDRKRFRSQLLPLVCLLLEEICCSAPLSLIWEDAQYIDAESIDILTPLAELIEANPILLLLIYRNGWKHPWNEKFSYNHLKLRPLSENGAQQLLRQELEADELPVALQQSFRVYKSLEGNPLYIAVWLRYLQDETFLQLVDGRWEVTRSLPEDTVPELIKRSLLARVWPLPEPLRQILRVMAVVEADFTARLLAEVLDEHVSNIEERFATLKNEEFIDRSGSKAGRRFSKVTREVLYDSLRVDERARLHRQVADALIDEANVNPFIVARHYYVGNDRARAADYALRAADQAAKGWNNTDALLWYERVREKVFSLREQAPSPLEVKRGAQPELLETWLRMSREGCADVQARVGLNRQAITLYRDLIAAAQNPPLISNQGQAELMRKLAVAYHDIGEFEQAQQWIEQGLILLGDLNSNERGRLLLWRSILFFRHADPLTALDVSHQAAEQLLLESRELAQARNLQCILYRRLGRMAEAVEAGEASVAIYRKQHDLLGLARALSNLGIAYDDLGRWREAQQCYQEGYDFTIKTGDVRALSSAAIDLGEFYRFHGELDQANAMYQIAFQKAQQAEDVEIQGAVLINQAMIVLKRQQFALAATYLEQSETLLKAAELELYEAELGRLRAEVQLGQHQPVQALRTAQQALACAQKANDHSELALIQRTCAGIYAALGQAELAEMLFTESADALRQQQRPYELGLTLLAHAAWLAPRVTPTSDLPKWQRLIDGCQEALTYFKELGAQLDQQAAQELFDHLRTEQ